MKRLLSIVATLSVLATAAPMAFAEDGTASTGRKPTTTGTMTSDVSVLRTAGPLPVIAIVGALLMVGGIREGLRRRTNA